MVLIMGVCDRTGTTEMEKHHCSSTPVTLKAPHYPDMSMIIINLELQIPMLPQSA